MWVIVVKVYVATKDLKDAAVVILSYLHLICHLAPSEIRGVFDYLL